ncbi:MAG: hypothetical protein LBT33_00875, partial [Spirochaetia bacterium]|nr:hypothetical protein [Spirochaetia bacterium]
GRVFGASRQKPGYPLQSFLRRCRKKGFPLLSLAQPEGFPRCLVPHEQAQTEAMHFDQKACVFPYFPRGFPAFHGFLAVFVGPSAFIRKKFFGPLALLPGGQKHALMGVRLFRRAQSVLSVVNLCLCVLCVI